MGERLARGAYERMAWYYGAASAGERRWWGREQRQVDADAIVRELRATDGGKRARTVKAARERLVAAGIAAGPEEAGAMVAESLRVLDGRGGVSARP